MARRNILITGDSGFLGRNLRKILSNSYEIIGLSRSHENLNIDISKPFDFDPTLNFDLVIHCAGKAHSIPRTFAEERDFFVSNFDGTRHLCQALSRLTRRPRALIYISSVAVYGLDHGVDISEEQPLLGTSPYAKSKILAEQCVKDWGAECETSVAILRLPLVIGPRAPGNFGAMVRGLRSHRYLRIAGSRTRKSVVWIDDIARIIPAAAKVGGIFNLTDGHHPSVRELEQVIAQKLRRGDPLNIPFWSASLLAHIGDCIGRRFPLDSEKLKKITSTLTFNDSAARNQLGWSPVRVVDKLMETGLL